jgi:hypothetical protein
MAYNKITDFDPNEGNPFLPATMVHVEKGEKTLLFGQKNPDLIIDSDSQVKGHSLFARKVTVDKAKFMKVFMSGLTNWFDLSKPAIRVFAYIAETLEPNRDSVDFSLEKCKEFTGFKAQKTILSALAELAANQFIARGPHPYKYFINPTIFFNGDRLTFIEQYEVEQTAELPEAETQKPDSLIESFEKGAAAVAEDATL